MKITEVRIRKILKEGKLKAIISITVDEGLVVHDIKLVLGNRGLFVSMPSRRDEEGKFRDVCHPITASVRKEIEQVILDAYNKKIKE